MAMSITSLVEWGDDICRHGDVFDLRQRQVSHLRKQGRIAGGLTKIKERLAERGKVSARGATGPQVKETQWISYQFETICTA
jgi:hypothetical protein